MGAGAKLVVTAILLLEAGTFVWNFHHINDIVLQYGWDANFRSLSQCVLLVWSLLVLFFSGGELLLTLCALCDADKGSTYFLRTAGVFSLTGSVVEALMLGLIILRASPVDQESRRYLTGALILLAKSTLSLLLYATATRISRTAKADAESETLAVKVQQPIRKAAVAREPPAQPMRAWAPGPQGPQGVVAQGASPCVVVYVLPYPAMVQQPPTHPMMSMAHPGTV